MTDNERSKNADDAANAALERELEDLGPLMDRKSDAEKDRADPSFVRDLRRRLAEADGPAPSVTDTQQD